MIKKLRSLVAGALLATAALYAVPSHAGLVWFSRANCINNESITWDWPGNDYWLWTNTYHFNNATGAWDNGESTGWVNSFRAAAVHWGEGVSGGYYVVGDHWQWDPYYGDWLLGRTTATDCNLSQFFPTWAY